MGEVTVKVIRLLHLPFTEIAKRLGVGYDTVKGWSSGRADPTAENRAALAELLRAHADELKRVADELET